MSILTHHGTKRDFLQFSQFQNISVMPSKKQKQMKYMNCIKNIKQSFTIEKLKMNKTNSMVVADDPLFNKQSSTKQSQYINWVIACKFIIATGLRLDSYKTHGMRRNKIAKNMNFYVDDQKNLCAVISNTKSKPIPADIITHCNGIGTSVIQTYYGMTRNTLQRFEDIFNMNEMMHEHDENEDDDLWTDTQQNTKYNIENINNKLNNIYISDKIITIIRIPQIYYSVNMELSFYWLCCRIAKYIFEDKKDFGHPLFQLLFRNIANFDCFMLSVPFVPLKGTLNEMFCQFALGFYKDNMEKYTINKNEFQSFLGTYDCWIEILRKNKCRKSMHKYWNDITQTDINIMNIVIEFADLHKMTDERIIEYIDQFKYNSVKYTNYFNQLNEQIPYLQKSIVNF